MNSPSTSQVRQWARRRGVQVGDRGRIPADLVAQYLAAHGPSSAPATKPRTPAARAAAPAAGAAVPIGRTVTAKPRWDWNR